MSEQKLYYYYVRLTVPSNQGLMNPALEMILALPVLRQIIIGKNVKILPYYLFL